MATEQKATFTCTATANPVLQNGEVGFRWKVDDEDEFECDDDERCSQADLQSTLELDTASLGQTTAIQCTAYVINGPDNACAVPEVSGSGVITVIEGKV